MNTDNKAKELYSKFHTPLLKYKDGLNIEEVIKMQECARQCALIAVDEIISQWEYIDTYLSDLKGELNPNLRYWYEVKQKINQL